MGRVPLRARDPTRKYESPHSINPMPPVEHTKPPQALPFSWMNHRRADRWLKKNQKPGRGAAMNLHTIDTAAAAPAKYRPQLHLRSGAASADCISIPTCKLRLQSARVNCSCIPKTAGAASRWKLQLQTTARPAHCNTCKLHLQIASAGFSSRLHLQTALRRQTAYANRVCRMHL